MRFLSV
jgi:hypothetical protein